MPNFILIEHGLTELGGHNFQYANDILGAAEKHGFAPVFAVNHSFTAPPSWPDGWKLLRPFEAESVNRHCLAVAGGSEHPIGVDGHWLDVNEVRTIDIIRDYWARKDRRWRINDLAEGCHELFRQIGFNADDRVFFSTLCEFDMLGLAKFLSEEPRCRQLDWHFQFHFDIFEGREPDYDRQSHLRNQIAWQVSEAIRIVEGCRMHWYATTEKVARQYDRLGHAAFQPLPYPINNRFLERGRLNRESLDTRKEPADSAVHELHPTRQFRVAFAGAMRREKGRRELANLIDSIGTEFLETGRVQLWVQSNKSNVRRLMNKRWWENLEIQPTAQVENNDPIVAIQHPLSPEDYLHYVCNADIGLFPYDSLRYHARCSGVLVEMLTVGLPVIVPAGCWLSDQVLRPTYQYLSQLAESACVLRIVSSEDRIRLGQSESAFETEALMRPNGASNVVVEFDYCETNPPGHEIRVECQQYDSIGNLVNEPWSSIVGPCAGQPLAACFVLSPEAEQLILRFENAFFPESLGIRQLRTTFVSPPETMPHHPRFAVGPVSTEHSQIPDLLREVIEHYPHYRQTANEYASIWSYEHDPDRTVELLDANCKQPTLSNRKPHAA